MSTSINTNLMSLNAQRNLSANSSSLATSMQRLSSGVRINSAKDDAAGLAISDRMSAQIRGMNTASRNANDGISLAQTAEGALGSITTNLQRMRELAVQAANASNSSSDRTALQAEVSQLASEIDRVATQTKFNGISLLDGSFTAKDFQIGANVGETITVSSIDTARSASLGTYQGFNVSSGTIGTASDTTSAHSVTVGGTTYALGTIANDAKAIASAVNSSGVAGFTASANATSVAGATTTVTGTVVNGVATVAINGVTISLTGTTVASTNRSNAVSAINAQSTATGVTATDTGTGVSLAASDGRNITVGSFAVGTYTTSTIADFGLAAAATTGASINLNYVAPSGVTGNMTFTNWTPGTQTIASTGTSVSAMDVSTVANAKLAITSLDAAIDKVNSTRATLGAYQNRFNSVVQNLATNSENLSASRGRIVDADFASETASLSRAQILQQAGTAMVAQANQMPQGVLALLK